MNQLTYCSDSKTKGCHLEAMPDYKSYEIKDESKIIRSIEPTRYGKRFRVVKVSVKLGGDFVLKLYDGLDKPKLVKSVERPKDGDIIQVNEIVEHELAYQLIPGYPGIVQVEPYSVTIVYEELPPQLHLGILTD